jgi:hypothetical protein
MSKAHERRLQALEATKSGGLGLRIFQQSLTDATVYYEGVGRERYGGEHGTSYSKAEIDALGNEGWQCIVLVYGRLNLGDESQEPAR